jgi:hypothetical protein
MMDRMVKDMVSLGFKVVGKGPGAVYVERGADCRVVLNNGTIKRGKPDHRQDRVNPK